jgi:hypothetical protein
MGIAVSMAHQMMVCCSATVLAVGVHFPSWQLQQAAAYVWWTGLALYVVCAECM